MEQKYGERVVFKVEFNQDLLKILACPQDKKPLIYLETNELYNPRLKLKYPIVDGIPVLLVDKAIKDNTK